MPIPFSLTGVLRLPPDGAAAAEAIPFGGAAQYDALAHHALPLAGAGSVRMTFAPPPARRASAMLVKALEGAAPLVVRAGDLPLAAGGFFAYFNPRPVLPIEALEIVHAGDALAAAWILG
jgi:hypothetical protein